MDTHAEWLEADGLGGFSSGTVSGLRTRRYHALLLCATTPPTGRFALVNGFDAFVTTPSARFALSTQKYAPDVIAPDDRAQLTAFTSEPWPTWTYRLADGTEIVQEICLVHGSPTAIVTWRVTKKAKAGRAKSKAKSKAKAGVMLMVRPFLSGRDQHALHRENGAFRFDADVRGADGKGSKSAKARARETRLTWRPYDGVPPIASRANAAYRHDPHWYRSFLLDEEAARGFDAIEDLAAPGEFEFDLTKGEAAWIVSADPSILAGRGDSAALAKKLKAGEAKRRAAFASPLLRAADAYLVRRGDGRTIVAGYPWFADWGRDTFIAMRGLCLATGRLDDARSILLQWAAAISEGMVPNRFAEAAGGGDAPEYNSVDASLWFVIALDELLAAGRRSRKRFLSATEEKRLLAAARAILEAYLAGTRHGIHIDDDELLSAGEPGQQLTWMDARVDGVVVTPRIGKAVEIQALWYNALMFGAAALKDGVKWRSRAADVHDSFAERFWNERDGCLFDVVDAGFVAGAVDPTFRPNQLLAIGGLPRPLLVGPRARKVVDAVEAKLVTPLGLRTLAPDDPRYLPRYEGGPSQRDAAYHQGSAWPWLTGPFVDAWIRVRGGTAAARREAHKRFVQPLLDRMTERGVAHLCELTDGEPPHGWRGCPFQAWSLGELLRIANGAKAAARGAS